MKKTDRGLWAVLSFPKNLFQLLIFLACMDGASGAGALNPKPASSSRTKIAFLAGFSSSVSSHVLTDLNLEKGYKLFAQVHPQFERTFEVVKFDNQGEAGNVVAEMEKIAANGIQFVIGLSKTSEALVAAPVADRRKMLLLTPMATNDKVTPEHPYMVRTCFADSRQSEALAFFALKELKAKRALVLTNVDSPYSVDLSRQFVRATKGKMNLAEFKYATEAPRLEELKKEVITFDPELVFIPDYVNTVSKLLKEIYSTNPKITLLGADGWGGREVLDPTVEPMTELRAYYTTLWDKSLKTEANKVFVHAHESLYRAETVTVGAAAMYDLLSIFWQAYQQAKPPKSPDTVRRQLLSRNFQTTTGPVRYTHETDMTPFRKVVLIRLNAGKHEFYKTL